MQQKKKTLKRTQFVTVALKFYLPDRIDASIITSENGYTDWSFESDFFSSPLRFYENFKEWMVSHGIEVLITDTPGALLEFLTKMNKATKKKYWDPIKVIDINKVVCKDYIKQIEYPGQMLRALIDSSDRPIITPLYPKRIREARRKYREEELQSINS